MLYVGILSSRIARRCEHHARVETIPGADTMPPMNRQTTTNALGAILIPSGCFAWGRDGQDHPRKTVVVLLKGRRRGREGADPACGRCGYNLTGSESNRCPECGTLFIEAGVTLGNPSPMKARWVLVSLVVLSSLFVAGLGLSVSHRAARRAQAQAQAKAQLLQMRAIETQAAATEAQ